MGRGVVISVSPPPCESPGHVFHSSSPGEDAEERELSVAVQACDY